MINFIYPFAAAVCGALVFGGRRLWFVVCVVVCLTFGSARVIGGEIPRLVLQEKVKSIDITKSFPWLTKGKLIRTNTVSENGNLLSVCCGVYPVDNVAHGFALPGNLTAVQEVLTREFPDGAGWVGLPREIAAFFAEVFAGSHCDLLDLTFIKEYREEVSKPMPGLATPENWKRSLDRLERLCAEPVWKTEGSTIYLKFNVLFRNGAVEEWEIRRAADSTGSLSFSSRTIEGIGVIVPIPRF